MTRPDELEHLIADLQKQRDQLHEQVETFSRRERTTSELLDKLQELRDRAEDTGAVKPGRANRKS